MMENNEMMNVTNAELVTPTVNVLDVQERASIDLQIATAKQYPRPKPSQYLQDAIDIATIDDETAESCIYRRPVGKDKDGRQNFAEGMSVRLAEIFAACYGNVRVGGRVIEQTDRYVKAQGVAHDLERNFYATTEVIESTVGKYGKPYDERMRVVIAKAAIAKARRDAIFQIIPRALAKPIENRVREMLYGDAKSLTKRRTAAEQWIKKLGIDEKRVYDALGIGGIEDMTGKHLETLTGLRTAIKDGEVSIDEAFPEISRNKFEEAMASAPATASAPAPEAEKKDELFTENK